MLLFNNQTKPWNFCNDMDYIVGIYIINNIMWNNIE